MLSWPLFLRWSWWNWFPSSLYTTEPNDNPALSIWGFTKALPQQFSALVSFPSLTSSLPFSASSCSLPLAAVIRNPCAREWVACQDQVCFCPFKAKKPRGTFPEREWVRKRAERREGHLEVIESKRKGSFLAEFMLLKCMYWMCSVLKTKAGMNRTRHFYATCSSLRP